MSDAAIASASWPGLARPPTTCGADRGKVMDGRHEAGHDTGERPRRLLTILTLIPACPGHLSQHEWMNGWPGRSAEPIGRDHDGTATIMWPACYLAPM